ncbi:dTDP-4-dehydrorhamnose 3,5-epimerase [Thermaurantiacus sp.]
MKVEPLAIPEVKLIRPRVHGDARGFFLETFNERLFEAHGLPISWAQDNHSRSARGVLRGLHYQLRAPQGKLVRVSRGRVFDVAVDIRRPSSTFGQWTGAELTDEGLEMLWIPPGFAHGFLVLSEVADVQYKCTTLWDPDSDRGIRWDDPAIGIAWPLDGEAPLLSPRDGALPLLAEARVFG